MREIAEPRLSVSHIITNIVETTNNPESQSIGIVVDIKNDISKTILYIADPDKPLYKQEIYLLMEVPHAVFNFQKAGIDTYKNKFIFFDYHERYDQVSVYCFCQTREEIPQVSMMDAVIIVDGNAISPFYLYEKPVEPFFPTIRIPWGRIVALWRALRIPIKTTVWRFVKKYGPVKFNQEHDELSPETGVTLPHDS